MAVVIDLSGQTALVTGASQGIGAEIARTLHRAGAGSSSTTPTSATARPAPTPTRWPPSSRPSAPTAPSSSRPT